MDDVLYLGGVALMFLATVGMAWACDKLGVRP